MKRQRSDRYDALHEAAAPDRVGQRVPPVSDQSACSPASGWNGDRRHACPTFLDLFCGCGGFTLGMQRAGFHVLAAIDFNEEAAATLQTNLGKETLALRKDLSKFPPDKLAAKIGVNSVDVIVGGPSCQGYSTVRPVNAANHGSRVRRDKRRCLYRYFLDYVGAFRRKVFVMENVLGLQSAAKGKFFTMVQAEARKLGYRVQAQVEESWKLCVLQKRQRQLVIGVRSDIPGYFPNELDPAERVRHLETPKLWAAIGDLPVLVADEGEEQREYDLELRSAHLATRGPAGCRYLRDVLEMDRAVKLTAHRARPHNARDLRDFAACGKASTAARPRRAAKSWSSPTIAPASPTDTSGNTGRTFAPPSSHTWARTG